MSPDAIMAGMDKEAGVVYLPRPLLDAYPIGHPVQTLAHMATHMAEHPAILGDRGDAHGSHDRHGAPGDMLLRQCEWAST